MIGLPYPNITSPELKEKIDYLNSTLVSYNRTTVGVGGGGGDRVISAAPCGAVKGPGQGT